MLQIEKADVDVAQWIERLFAHGPWDASLYDTKIPIPSTSPEDAVAVICENIAKDALRPNDQSKQATLDFLLALRA